MCHVLHSVCRSQGLRQHRRLYHRPKQKKSASFAISSAVRAALGISIIVPTSYSILVPTSRETLRRSTRLWREIQLRSVSWIRRFMSNLRIIISIKELTCVVTGESECHLCQVIRAKAEEIMDAVSRSLILRSPKCRQRLSSARPSM